MTHPKKIFNIDFVFVLILIGIAILFRSYKVTSPLIEYHSWRQADTLAVARNFAHDGIDLLHPAYDDISPLQTGVDNPNGYRMVELPILNAVIAIAFMMAPVLNIVVWGRIISTILSVITLVCVYSVTRRESNRFAAVIASVIFATFPFFVFYTRAVLPEVMVISLLMGAVIALYSKISPARILIALVLFACAVLVKPTAIFFGLPLWYLLIRGQRMDIKSYAIRTLALGIALVPFVLWRTHISYFPEGIPASEWLFTYTNTSEGLKYIFFKPAFFRWIFQERLNILILGSYGLVLFIVGLITRTKTLLPHALLVSSLAYLFTFQGGNVQHEYYQIIILPTVAIFAGLGASYMVKSAHHWVYQGAGVLIVVACLCAGWFISWDKVHHYYYSLSDIPQFAKVVQTFTKTDDRIVVDTGGDTTALFAFDRKGAPAIYTGTKEYREKGYTYLFTYNHTTADSLQKSDPLIKRVFENSRFVLFKL